LVKTSAPQEESASAPTLSDRVNDSDGSSLSSIAIPIPICRGLGMGVGIGIGIDALFLNIVQLESLGNSS